ncbi:DedA family protein [Microbacterium sp. SCN 69-37]|uniref:DedA family protein n=1 Tax=Microbacterium sp. SCN 69-37 TaxID=1660115 RepID=UPI00086C6685|nr:DedA family protein [Microbacterium sp. SCN 69-37]ODT23529.1 MAG: hypothetical protein ABS64_09570 [Microbacterium sp. SCN 69-37]
MAMASDGSWLTTLVDAVVGLMNLIGAPGAGLAIALENLFPPLPSEVILPMAGLAAARGSFTLFEALACTTAGSVVGAFALYALGAGLGIDRLRALVRRMPLLKVDDVDRTVAWFQRHGGKAVFFGRMLPIFRSLISIPAGVTRMPLWRFGLLTLAGSFIWNAVFVLSGYLLGDQWHIVEDYAGVLQYAVIAVAATALVWFAVNRARRLRGASADSDPA